MNIGTGSLSRWGFEMKYADVTLTAETIQRTREHFAENKRACARVCVEYGQHGPLQEGGFHVNGREEYVAQCARDAEAFLAGEYDYSFTFAQRAHYLQTGESIPLFSK
jgi:hypothetical protein